MADDVLPETVEFAVVLRGYDREQVDGFLAGLIATHEALRAECEHLRRELEDGRQRIAPLVAALHGAEQANEARLETDAHHWPGQPEGTAHPG
ncbi:MAG TPA: DivIVA domain-containing protein [Acidimicrobiales bacterium]|nr:DivIVA domain-containing protein [Acidimicrobiales bacterium]